MLDQQGKLRSRQLDHKHMSEVMLMAIIQHDLPYSFVKYWIRKLLKLLNPNVKNINMNTTMFDV